MLNPSAWANEPEIFVKVTGGFVNVMSRAMGANKEFKKKQFQKKNIRYNLSQLSVN
jgi:hypothetical protein